MAEPKMKATPNGRRFSCLFGVDSASEAAGRHGRRSEGAIQSQRHSILVMSDVFLSLGSIILRRPFGGFQSLSFYRVSLSVLAAQRHITSNTKTA